MRGGAPSKKPIVHEGVSVAAASHDLDRSRVVLILRVWVQRQVCAGGHEVKLASMWRAIVLPKAHANNRHLSWHASRNMSWR